MALAFPGWDSFIQLQLVFRATSVQGRSFKKQTVYKAVLLPSRLCVYFRLSFPTITINMLFTSPILVLLFTSFAIAQPKCLTDQEANHLATAWLHLWDTNAVSSMADLTPILSPNIASYDYSYGPPTVGIKEFLAAVTARENPSEHISLVLLLRRMSRMMAASCLTEYQHMLELRCSRSSPI